MQQQKGKQGIKLILTHGCYTGDKFCSRQKGTFEVPCCMLRVHKKEQSDELDHIFE